jgi:hypothetical protein
MLPLSNHPIGAPTMADRRLPSRDPNDFDPNDDRKLEEPKLCARCKRIFLNRWVFLRHLPEGRSAITEPLDPTRSCYSDRHLRRKGMWKTHQIWMDSAAISPLDEDPGIDRDRGDGRPFSDDHKYSRRYQQWRRRKRDRGSNT